MDRHHETTLARLLTRRLNEELLAYDEIESLLGALPSELVEHRESAQRKLHALDLATIEINKRREVDGA